MFVWESPNFGDGAKYGYHMHSRDREVYQREVHEARYYGIAIEMLRSGGGQDNPNVYRFAVDQLLSQGEDSFETELFFMLNLLQENTGAVGVFPSDASRDDYLETVHLNWEFFPPGTRDEVVGRMIGHRQISPEEAETVAARVELFSRLRPRAYLKGTGGMSSYVGAQFADDLVVFENVKYGNAMYILFDEWQEISQRSRLEILGNTDARFDRIVHRDGWEAVFRKKLQIEKRKRRIFD